MLRTVHTRCLLLLALSLIWILSAGTAVAQNCGYFNEPFGSPATHSWQAANGNWTFGSGRLNVTDVVEGKWAYATTEFGPSDYFTLDVDFQLTSSEGAVALYPFTNGDLFLAIQEGTKSHTVDGLGALVFKSGNAFLFGWDVGRETWYQSSGIAATAPVTSIGVRYSATEIVLRINRTDTSHRVTGQFQLAPSVLEELWLMVSGTGASAWFDNVCAGPGVTPQRTLSVAKTGTGRGLVTSSPAGISCGGTCSAAWSQGTAVTLSASPESGSTFAGWTGAGCSGTGNCQVTLSADTSVTARFEADIPPQANPDGAIFYFPYYQGGPSGYTAFAVSNWSERSAAVEFRAYGADGKLLGLTRNPRSFTLRSKEQLARLGHEIFEVAAGTVQSGWVELHSDNADVGTFFQVGTGDGQELDGSVPFSEAHRKLVFTRIHHGTNTFRGKSAQTLISLANPNAHAVTVNLLLYGTGSGQLLAERRSVSIPAKGMLYGPLNTVMGRSLTVNSGYLVAEVTAGDGLTGFELIQLSQSRTRIGLSAWGPNQSNELYSAQLAHLDGFFTSIKLVNTGTAARQVSLWAVGENGSVLAQSLNRRLNPGQVLEQDAGQIFGWSAGQTRIGSLKILADGSGVVGDVVFGDGGTGLGYAAAMPLQNRFFTKGVFSQVAQLNLPYFYTGLAFYNPGNATANIAVETFRPDGTRSGVKSPAAVLGPGRRVSKVLPEHLALPNFQQAGGYILVQSDQPLIAQQLFGSAAVMSAVPAGVQRPVIAGPGGSYMVPADQSDRTGSKATLVSAPTTGLTESGQTIRSVAVQTSITGDAPMTGDGMFRFSIPLNSTPSDPSKLLLNVRTRTGELFPVLGRYNAANRTYEVETPGLDHGWIMAVVESPGLSVVTGDADGAAPAGWLTPPEWETCEFAAVNHNNAVTAAQIRNTYLPAARSACSTLSNAGFRSPRLYIDRNRNPAARLVHVKNNFGSKFAPSLEDQDPAIALSSLNEQQMMLLGQMYVDPQQLANLSASYGITLGNIFIHELFHAVQWGYDIRYRFVQEGTGAAAVWRSPLKAYYEGTATPVGQTYQATSSVTGPDIHVRALHGGEFAHLDDQIDDFRDNIYTKQDFFAWLARKHENNSFAFLDPLFEQMGLDSTGRNNLTLDQYIDLYRQSADTVFRRRLSKGFSELYAEFALDRLYKHPPAAVMRTAETANFRPNKLADNLIRAAGAKPQLDPESTDAAKRRAEFVGLKSLSTVVAQIPVSSAMAASGTVNLEFTVTGGEVKSEAVRITVFKENDQGEMLAGGEIPVNSISQPLAVSLTSQVKRLTVIVSNSYLQQARVVRVTVTVQTAGACPGGAPPLIAPGVRENWELSMVNTADVNDCPPWENSSYKNVLRRACIYLQDGTLAHRSPTCYSHPQEVKGTYNPCTGNLTFEFKLLEVTGTWGDWVGNATATLAGGKITGTWSGTYSFTYQGKPCVRNLSGHLSGK